MNSRPMQEQERNHGWTTADMERKHLKLSNNYWYLANLRFSMEQNQYSYSIAPRIPPGQNFEFGVPN